MDLNRSLFARSGRFRPRSDATIVAHNTRSALCSATGSAAYLA
jgi:hypothetical protein